MGPLGHEPPVLVNHEQTPVFGNTPALDLHVVGMHQPQGFYRCEMNGLNGDHDTPPACALPWTPWMLQHATVTASLQFHTLALPVTHGLRGPWAWVGAARAPAYPGGDGIF